MITPRRIVISIVLAGCAVLLVWGLSGTRSATARVTYTDPAVVSLEPQPGVLALRQERIGVTLATPFTLEQATTAGMAVNDTPIPQDQIEVVPGLNQYFYTPGPGKEVSELPPGRNCVTIVIKRVTDPTDTGHRFAWCFNSH